MARLWRKPVVLAYHGVSVATEEDDPARLITSPRHLESHIRFLLDCGYRFVSVAELDGLPPAPRTAVLTFDDGWFDGLSVVTPMLQRLGITATFYLCPGWWGGRHPDVQGEAGRLLGRDDAVRLHQEGMEVASHTMLHRDLRLLTPAQLKDDLASSKAELEDLTGTPCRSLAYPFGLFGPREEEAVAEAGYELGVAWTPGPWSPRAVPRMPAPPRHGAARLALKLLGVRRRPERTLGASPG